ncbi:MAG TPA: metallophosphoesterase [Hyphomicrobiales bacterium]|jgi:3',5'-cyclic AMP phosphodiesterase CpdA
MTVIALLADLHFGSVPPGLAEQLRQDLVRLAPDLVVIAGDLTLQWRRREFDEAKRWLTSLPSRFLALPGNHDLPESNLFERMFRPFSRYLKFIGQPLMPVYEDDTAFVLGLNTTASLPPTPRWREGVARRVDIANAGDCFALARPGKTRIVVTHHPLVAGEGFLRARPVRRAKGALDRFAAQGVEILMSGYLHQSFAVELRRPHGGIIAIGAPTSLSTRIRGEPNGFWLIDVQPDAVRLTLHSFDGASFAPGADPLCFHRRRTGTA